ncbi:hypothetical protein K239x_00410 [Planctomycetes bacterium K23_9]|uniref:Uncharacterized protein n=1 Tax=Stieleria marina TaxID=1930275 RepID=A0A517NLV8_9BACT|nr:hypothetical protein K239x_00410 [Planctomycetes bacterium K23_9]
MDERSKLGGVGLDQFANQSLGCRDRGQETRGSDTIVTFEQLPVYVDRTSRKILIHVDERWQSFSTRPRSVH